MTATSIASIAIGGAGLLLALISIPFFLRKQVLEKKCSAKTTGTVIKYRYGGNADFRSIAPVVEFCVNGKMYKAYRHYKGVVSKKIVTPNPDTLAGQNNSFYISEKDVFHINKSGVYHNYSELCEKMWPLGSELPVVYNPEKPKQAFVEKVVSISNIAGIVLLCVGCGFMAMAAIAYLVF